MRRGYHETVAIVIVLLMRCRVGIGCGFIGAVDHESDVVTASRFEAIVRVVSRVQVLERKRVGLDSRVDLGDTYSRIKGMANSRVISGSSISGVRRRHWATSAG